MLEMNHTSKRVIIGPPRTTGPSGTHILDTWVPPKTTVHTPVYTLHRDVSHFGPLADQYIPERWLEPAGEDVSMRELLLPCNREAFMPFSAGYASCVGKHLAVQNIK